MKDTKKAGNLIISIAVIVLSIIFYVEASKMPAAQRGIGPGDFPKVICGVLFVLGIINVASIIVTSKGIPTIDFKNIQVRFLVRAAIMMLMTYLYYRFLKKVGFLLLTPVFLFASFMLFGYKKKVVAAIVAIVIPVVIYFLFVNVFMVLLPRGFLG